MDFSEHRYETGKKLAGIAFVVLIHALLIYALINGLGKHIISVIQELPIQVILMEEVKPPAPPTPAAPLPPKHVTPSKPLIRARAPELPIQQAPSPNAAQAITNEQPPQSDMQVQAPANAEPAKGPTLTNAVVDFTTCAKPDYPRNSLRNEEQGTVRIQFLIDVDGHVADSNIARSSGFRTLDAAAKKALSLCKFKPGTIDGKPQQTRTTVEYVWKLPD